MNDHSASDSLQEACALLRASSPSELTKKFVEEDQRLLQTQEWDYQNHYLVLNKVKDMIECAINDGFVSSEYNNDGLRDALWFWYHHATGYAIWKYKDKAKALEFSAKALEYQITENQNKITRLLYLLVRDKREDANAWLKTIVNESDKTVALGILEEFRAGNFPKT